MRRFRFSQRYCLRFRSPGRLHCVDLSVVADVSNELIDFVFRVKQSWTIHIYIWIYIDIYTGRFIMFSVITNIYNKKTEGPTLMELFTTTGKLFFFGGGATKGVRCVHHG